MTEALARLARRQLPRMLTQVSRDPGSPLLGCWDRNWWHYKIRDFPSIILQQGGYAMAVAAGLDDFSAHAEPLRRLAAASARFWNERAVRHGAFEEYYPFEQGYPPLAFGTLGIAKLAASGVISTDSIRPGLERAARQLLDRFEAQAANQQVAGTAAAAVIRSIAPDLVPDSAFKTLLDRTLELQHEEGWFPEYDGPDLGYLAVTMDCLWDTFDVTGDIRCCEAINRAFEFIAWFIDAPPGRAGMHNSRNTDYLVPYAIARLASAKSPRQAHAARVFRALFETADQPDHFFAAVDDRYWCHYIGHSVFRSLHVLAGAAPSANAVPPDFPPAAMEGSGHIRLCGDSAVALVSTRKGAVTTVEWPAGSEVHDYGWIVRRKGNEWVSHWWTPAWNVGLDPSRATCSGTLVGHREQLSSPLKHLILRTGSWVFGRHLIRTLKRLLIFKKSDSGIHFDRAVRFDGDTLVIADRIDGLHAGDEVVRAPRSSKRHVASADNFHPEDLHLLQKAGKTEEIVRKNSSFQCETHYFPAESNAMTDRR